MSLKNFFHINRTGNYREKCEILLTQIKGLDKIVWRELNSEFREIELGETWDFSRQLGREFQVLSRQKARSRNV